MSCGVLTAGAVSATVERGERTDQGPQRTVDRHERGAEETQGRLRQNLQGSASFVNTSLS